MTRGGMPIPARRSRTALAAALLTVILVACLAPAIALAGTSEGIALDDNVGLILDLPDVDPGTALVSDNFFIDVPADARQLRVELSPGTTTSNVDVYLKPETPFANINSVQDIEAQAFYYSAGESGTDFVTILDSAYPPVQNQRWFIVIVAAEGSAGDATLVADYSSAPPAHATITVDYTNPLGFNNCQLTPWDDSTPFTPVGGNNATTLGQARRNAIERAAANLSAELFSPSEIRINACWRAQGASDPDTGQVLAGANYSVASFGIPGTKVPGVVYSTPAAVRQAGTSMCRLFPGQIDCDSSEIFILFNSDVDDDGLGSSFYYGFDDFESGQTVHFLSVATHEITHGLGFAARSDEDGALASVADNVVGDIFVSSLLDTSGSGAPVGLNDPGVSDAARAAAFTSVNNLRWGPEAANVNPANPDYTQSDSRVGMFAPSTYDPGSSVSHLDQNFCDLMRSSNAQCINSPLRSLGIARPMLNALGWHPARNQPGFLGQLFDRSRNGHGYDFQLGGFDANGNAVYVLTFYTFELLGGAPEWFQAIGTIQDGAFVATRNADGFGFPRYTYNETNIPPQTADPGTKGQAVVSFNAADISPACTDGVNRNGVASVASFQWVISTQVDAWCVEPLVRDTTRPAIDFGGLYFAGEADTGWGFSLENIQNDDGSIDVFVLLYVYAADGSPVWFFGFESGFEVGQPLTFDMFQRNGYSRVRTGTLADTTDVQAGTLTLTLVEPSNTLGGGNTVSVDVTYQGNEGGDWLRNQVPIQRLSLARQ